MKIHTYYWRKPIPTDRFDWSAVLDDYDGAPDSSNRGQICYGPTEADAIEDLLEHLDETN